ncbi:DUF2141 domain-containing protein [Croceibacterium atlanticum]|uniref:DUF2141 domain-containing protein n=1 Tax=Croceibacterium atlanticum TaxID=1267766 RepID=UPI002E27CF6D|nr:DUF2141 domain-containing protein [Croceibacterium atlanticum]
MAPLLISASPPIRSVEVQIDLTGLRSAKGVVLACMTSQANHFPQCDDDDEAYTLEAPANQALTLTFRDVQPGDYAISVLHDENDNGKVDRVLGMIPKEGFGFSRDAKVKLGPPDFRDAAFTVGNVPVRQAIRMRYML